MDGVTHNRLDIERVLSREKKPLEAVHIDFMKYLGVLPKSSPLWILYNEVKRTPLHFHWLALCARFWAKATAFYPVTDPLCNLLLRNCKIDNANLMINVSNCCWVAKFLHSMVDVGVISRQELNTCKSLNDYVALAICEAMMMVRLQSLWHGMCQVLLKSLGLKRTQGAFLTPCQHTCSVPCLGHY